MSEAPEAMPALARVCAFAAEHGIRLAGAERQVATSGFKRYVDMKLLKVVMPDIKYAGGYSEIPSPVCCDLIQVYDGKDLFPERASWDRHGSHSCNECLSSGVFVKTF